MKTQGEVVSINISEKKGVPKQSIDQGIFKENHGLEGDAHAGPGHRQVSFLAVESIEKMKKQDVKGLCVGKFAENITTKGIVLYELPVGTKLKIGDTIQEITQIGKECHDECAIKQQVGQCIMPKEGVFARVVQGGLVKIGDSLEEFREFKHWNPTK